MRGNTIASALATLALIATTILGTPAIASSPSAGTVSTSSPTVTWSGGPFLVSNPIGCSFAEATCDSFSLTVVAPSVPFQVRIVVVATQSDVDDIDLFVRDSSGVTIGSSATPSSREELVLSDLASGTYTIIVQPSLVVPPSTYRGSATLQTSALDAAPSAFRATPVGPGFQGIPQNASARSSGQALRLSLNYVGRQAAEPTIGVNGHNTAFFAAGTFDSVVGVPGVTTLARTVVMKSTNKGRTWVPASPPFLLGQSNTTEPPFSLDPYIHVDPVTGRIFSVDLNLACAYLVFSDNEGATWERNPVACGQPVNDHQSLVTGPVPAGLATIGYPRVVYYCFNRVADTSCSRSLDGGRTFAVAGTAYIGDDPAAGGICGGLAAQAVTDSVGRIFIGKGHCGKPWVAMSANGGTTWTRTKIADHIVMADHEVSLAVDDADNLYATWTDGVYRLPFLSVSSDHGATWSTPAMIAPPPVHETNFPTVVAGAAGRIAVLFPGTHSWDRNDPGRPWNLYVVLSLNGLAGQPVFTWATANNPADPVHRGNCGPDRCDAQDRGSMLDFLDIQISPADGAIWGTLSDTCVGACVTDPTAKKLRPGQGAAIRQEGGPRLRR